ncbi:hypothetical protein AB0N87_26555 [Streptomyces sp. NPDC093228]|uniref:hypothetical protein n=1 Tax=unclassified Streptomyces TaxID=2593676 RepID=UPI000E37CF09|nr:hypothetical protein [Streptomyces sp. 3212.3]REE66138.1 hypothetical protein BX257_8951 [Streptomyces sp. 3212.3]
MFAHQPANDSTLQESAVEDVARLVERIARSTGATPESVLAGISEEVLAALFLLQTHVREARQCASQRPGRRASLHEPFG